VFADAYPVGDSPFPEYGEPFLADALVHLGCQVERLDRAGDHHLVLALVERAELREGEPLIRYRRSYRRLQDDG
jgi:flavin reductase (DIM6/NTAB) family NADH-FMN oxidoreductase RutF